MLCSVCDKLKVNVKYQYNDFTVPSNSDFYTHGIDWYMKFFPQRKHGNKTVLFEKSATYFDSSPAPQRAFQLLKNAKLVVILISPSDRAYSWYQHMRAKNDPTALNHTFYIWNPCFVYKSSSHFQS